jgi:glycosyltransferase involved in cell wall biosynthesis
VTLPIRILALLEATTVTGPAKNLIEFARLAREPRFDPPVHLSIAACRRPGDSTVLQEAVEAAGIPFHPIPERGPFDRAVVPALRELARSVAPDILQTHAVKSHFLLRWAALDRTAPWVAFHHGYTWPDLRARAYNQLDRWSLRRALRVITVSQPFRAELAAHGVPLDRISVIHNAIDPGWAASAQASSSELKTHLGISSDRKVVLIVGRLSREKDHLTLLDALASIRSTHAPHLLIVGDGPERTRIEERARALAMEKHVALTGQVRSAQPYYGIADVAVLSSRSEGSPNALLEAMAAGVPVVATSVGGIPEIVTDRESALLVPPSDSPALAGAIASLLSRPELAESLRTRARQLIVERHSPEQRTRALCRIYREALAAQIQPRTR